MRRTYFIAAMVLAVVSASAFGQNYQTKVHTADGGDELVVESGGRITVKGGGQINLVAPKGDVWFVDTANGDDNANDGTSWDQAYATMRCALSGVGDGDTIMFTGTVQESELVLDEDNVSIIGAGTCPEMNIWQQSEADSTLLYISGDGNYLSNIRFRIPTSAAADGSSRGLELTNADWTTIVGCLFQGRSGSSYAIATDGSADNVRISDCRFMYLNTATYGTAIFGHTYTADVIGSGWVIENSIFHSNLRHVYVRLRQSVIRGCQFAEKGLGPTGAALTATTKINLSGGSNAMLNLVTGNMLPGDYSNTGGYTAGTNDNWVGNWADDVSEAEVGDNGVTLAIPTT